MIRALIGPLPYPGSAPPMVQVRENWVLGREAQRRLTTTPSATIFPESLGFVAWILGL